MVIYYIYEILLFSIIFLLFNDTLNYLLFHSTYFSNCNKYLRMLKKKKDVLNKTIINIALTLNTTIKYKQIFNVKRVMICIPKSFIPTNSRPC